MEKFIEEITSNVENNINLKKSMIPLIEELGLNDLRHEYSKNAKGCMHRCPFCNKKCESTELGDHKHHADITGHQPHIFAGKTTVMKGKEVPSLVMCDLIESGREIEINGVQETWEKIVGQETKWNIPTGLPFEEHEARLKMYSSFWKVHGDQFCQKYKVENVEENLEEFLVKYDLEEPNFFPLK